MFALFLRAYKQSYVLLCLFMLSTMPIADIKTTKLVLPAEMNESGSPVGGIEPDMTCYCTEIIELLFLTM